MLQSTATPKADPARKELRMPQPQHEQLRRSSGCATSARSARRVIGPKNRIDLRLFNADFRGGNSMTIFSVHVYTNSSR